MGKKGPLWWRESDWLLRGSSAANQIFLRHSGPILSINSEFKLCSTYFFISIFVFFSKEISFFVVGYVWYLHVVEYPVKKMMNYMYRSAVHIFGNLQERVSTSYLLRLTDFGTQPLNQIKGTHLSKF